MAVETIEKTWWVITKDEVFLLERNAGETVGDAFRRIMELPSATLNAESGEVMAMVDGKPFAMLDYDEEAKIVRRWMG